MLQCLFGLGLEWNGRGRQGWLGGMDENGVVMIDESGRLVHDDWLRMHGRLLADDGLGETGRSW